MGIFILIFVSSMVHGAEFVDDESFVVFAGSFLSKENGAFGSDFD